MRGGTVSHYIMEDTYFPTLPCEVQGYTGTYRLNPNRYLGYSVMTRQNQGTQLKPPHGWGGIFGELIA